MREKDPRKNNFTFLIIYGIIFTIIGFLLDKLFLKLMITLQNDFFIILFSIITMIGNLEWFISLALIILIILILRNKKIYSYIAALFVSAILSYVLKWIISRPRPFEFLQIPSIINTSMSSFPSGHALVIFTMLAFLIMNFPRYKYWFWSIAVLVAFSRIYLGVHYLSDVIAGAFLGFFIAKLFIYIGEKNAWR
ncbi:TPA: phosphatase PAP2 family protein [Candidatus Woesearchaeota archaeon]|nr:phosphatase PAP2 family protein [Candidatus Woesearchaeota archaeon]HIH31372.1 phosphatase PAP2 family protein [Candidatus Woesearchaeota archaeon]HIH54422.1 phosphatase PAP2 family protein [Candidatus Woesearchaeota archaeon]HIJ02379.1 phosphatase PAP2 family protein [Candidatus Woesearchaeota archaeon]HIJ14143.1 phosphatase PAP2 family protein [Candidatus Woesearchaeota archaeon]